jgi:hypothetical protein
MFPKEHVLSIWNGELDQTREWGGLVTMLLHPQVTGRPMRLGIFREFLARARGYGDVWIAAGRPSPAIAWRRRRQRPMGGHPEAQGSLTRAAQCARQPDRRKSRGVARGHRPSVRSSPGALWPPGPTFAKAAAGEGAVGARFPGAGSHCLLPLCSLPFAGLRRAASPRPRQTPPMPGKGDRRGGWQGCLATSRFSRAAMQRIIGQAVLRRAPETGEWP